MHKIVEEPKLLGHKEINGAQVPIYSCMSQRMIVLLTLIILTPILPMLILREMLQSLHHDFQVWVHRIRKNKNVKEYF